MRYMTFLLVFCILLLISFSSAHAATDQQAVVAVNEIRAQIGSPPVKLDPSLSRSCALHVNYMQQNKTVTHFEKPLNVGYTPSGDQAGQKSVLAFTSAGVGGYTDSAHNPWYPGAPLHLFQLLHPALTHTGYADGAGYSCMNTLARSNYARGARQIINFPADGQTNVPVSENTQYESPDPTVDYFHLPKGTDTGPYMFIYAYGFSNLDNRVGTRLVSVQMKDSWGADVAVMKYDGQDQGAFTLNGTCLRYAYSLQMPVLGAYIVPKEPLRQAETYTVSVHVKSLASLGCFAHALGSEATKTFSFTTAGAGEGANIPAPTDAGAMPTIAACKIIVKRISLSDKRRQGRFIPNLGCKQLKYLSPVLEVKMLKNHKSVWVKQRSLKWVTRGTKKSVRVHATKAGKRVIIYSAKF